MKNYIFLFICLVHIKPSFSQGITDSAIFIPMFSAAYSLQIPGGDMANRFGINSNIGGNFNIKFKANWIFGLNFGYLFGKQIKETGIFDSIDDSNGEIITIYGDYAELSVSERGFHAFVSAGKIFPVFKKQPNSGILAQIGTGFLQHKIWIEVDGNNAPQLSGDYRKGYDRLTNGFAINEFLGYIYFSKHHLINFYAGIELIQAWTKNRRTYNYDTRMRDVQQRLDLLYSIKAGWIIPLYRRVPEKFYTY
ncbi:MAG: hypothetical protein HY738_07085 [Bacteroidia bacterium]|nr:hypothetical protein [Bacteroidia bacterium]